MKLNWENRQQVIQPLEANFSIQPGEQMFGVGF
jgi:hypothetical protein